MKRDLLSLIASVLASSVAGVAVSSQRTLKQQMSEVEASAARAVIQDRLTGARIDLESLIPQESLQPTSERTPAVVWVLDMARCPDCFDNLGPWSRLETLVGHRFLLIYTGTPTGEIQGRLRSLTTTRVLPTTPEQVTETFGLILPNSFSVITNLAVTEDSLLAVTHGSIRVVSGTGRVVKEHHSVDFYQLPSGVKIAEDIRLPRGTRVMMGRRDGLYAVSDTPPDPWTISVMQLVRVSPQ